MYLIGLCGRSGSGKSSVCRILSKRGVHCIDADEVCRQVYKSDSACLSELAERFGQDITEGGIVNRALLSRRSFESGRGVADLNAITHKYIVAEILAQAEKAFASGVRYVVADAPTLFESGLDRRCDAVIAVFSGGKARCVRLKQRENIGDEALRRRLNAQKSNAFLLNNCDAVIKNTGTFKELYIRTHRAMLLVQIKLGILHTQKEKKRYAVKKTP